MQSRRLHTSISIIYIMAIKLIPLFQLNHIAFSFLHQINMNTPLWFKLFNTCAIFLKASYAPGFLFLSG